MSVPLLVVAEQLVKAHPVIVAARSQRYVVELENADLLIREFALVVVDVVVAVVVIIILARSVNLVLPLERLQPGVQGGVLFAIGREVAVRHAEGQQLKEEVIKMGRIVGIQVSGKGLRRDRTSFALAAFVVVVVVHNDHGNRLNPLRRLELPLSGRVDGFTRGVLVVIMMMVVVVLRRFAFGVGTGRHFCCTCATNVLEPFNKKPMRQPL